ncbi:allograft inflammatory factor 1-like [Pelobates fuscus]|uniref:allograft inflammatory factor 1-like n=1 Tax=Pelobates fuscus TaxID=191477 RepID=UPI002FE4C1FF
MDYNHNKLLGKFQRLELDIDYANKEYLGDEPFQDITDLSAKLYKLKCAFLQYDINGSGEIDYMTFHVMAQGLGIYRSMSELKKRVQEITGNKTCFITYKDCAMAMLGRRSTMCQRILTYSEKGGEFVRRPCLLDSKAPSYVSYLEFAVHPSRNMPLSPVQYFPPPPPPSPADMDVFSVTRTFSTAHHSFGKLKRGLE